MEVLAGGGKVCAVSLHFTLQIRIILMGAQFNLHH